MIQHGGLKMRRAIRGAQSGLRRLARFQMRLIKERDLKRRGGVVPGDLSSGEKNVGTDGLQQDEFDDLDVISLEALTNYRKWLNNHNNLLEISSSLSSSDDLPEPSPDKSAYVWCNQRAGSVAINIETGGPGRQRNVSGFAGRSRSKRSPSHQTRGRRSRMHTRRGSSQKSSHHLGYTEQHCQRSTFLDFLFEDSPPPSRFLTSQALQNILGCPKCREIVPIVPSDISTSRGCRPCEQCLGHSETGKCLLCECSYGETKSLLLEKLTMRSWLRPCRYQSYGCQSLVGMEVIEDGEHNEDECEFRPLHCPFMLCRRRFSKESLIKHLHTEHHLYPHDGPKLEGNIICLPSNKRHRGARANYTLDPCAVSCYGNIFILRILRHSTSWYIWVWTCRPDEEKIHKDEGTREKFRYTIRFRHPASRSNVGASPALTLTGVTASLWLSMEEIMERGLCQILPEQGSLFDCPEENDSLVVDFALVIHPPVSTPKVGLRFQPPPVATKPPPHQVKCY